MCSSRFCTTRGLNDGVGDPAPVRDALRSSLAVVDGMIAEVGGEPAELNLLATNGDFIVAVSRAPAADGREMAGDDWGHVDRRALGMQIGNDNAPTERILLLFNASKEAIAFNLAEDFPCDAFAPVFSSTSPDGLYDPNAKVLRAGEAFPLPSRSFVLLQHQT